MYVHRNSESIDREKAVWVDDIILFKDNNSSINYHLDYLFKMKNLGELSYLVSIKIKYNQKTVSL